MVRAKAAVSHQAIFLNDLRHLHPQGLCSAHGAPRVRGLCLSERSLPAPGGDLHCLFWNSSGASGAPSEDRGVAVATGWVKLTLISFLPSL